MLAHERLAQSLRCTDAPNALSMAGMCSRMYEATFVTRARRVRPAPIVEYSILPTASPGARRVEKLSRVANFLLTYLTHGVKKSNHINWEIYDDRDVRSHLPRHADCPCC